MSKNSDDIDHRPDNTAPEPAAYVDAEREKLLDKRRARQMNKSNRRSGRTVVLAAAMVLAGSTVAFVVAVGPTQALKFVGLEGDDEEKTSQVDLNVERVTSSNQKLDFSVPEPPAAIGPAGDPNAEMNKRFEELRKDIDAVARSHNGSSLSLTDVQKLLDQYNKDMTLKLQQDREKTQAEDARLRAEALRLEEERRRSDEGMKLDAERIRQSQEISTKQRESNGVIVDESGAHLASTQAAPQIDQDLTANDRFLTSAAGSETKTSVSRALTAPSLTVVQGTIISAVLETAIDTELPGNLRAQIIEPVFSFDGSRILLPAGTNLIGTFSNGMDLEQKRVLIAWNRAITPEGKSIALGSSGTDLLGRAGTEGNVDNRYGKKIGAAILISTITALPSILPALTGSDESSKEGTTTSIRGAGSSNDNAGSQAMSNTAGAISDQSEGPLDKYLSLPPVLRIPQGEEIRVFVNRDLVIR
ncbi:TrbI/VirB10 family protein [Ensifer aridi]|uniref:TrbI/VirB10 family protein n=1 Tax=Ensifer aridi TaxID=1708715 RepID=UPI001FCCF42B|nr:TrbI/VirB10 family protein [Ensifer aridi]